MIKLENKTIKLALYNSLSLLSTVIILIAIYTIFEDSIYIESHYDPKVLVLSGSILLSSILITSFGLAKLLGETIYHSIMRLGLGLMMSIFSINIISLFQMSIKILGYNDIIYNGKFFTIYYKYSKIELLKYVNKYYNDISGANKVLSLQEQIKILGDAKTITEVQAQVEKYYNIEVNSWWAKLSPLLEMGMNWCITNPIISGSIIIGIGTLVVIPGIKILYNQYNIFKVATTVSDLNKSIKIISEENKGLIQFCMKLQIATSEINENTIRLMGIINDFLFFNTKIISTFNLTETQEKGYIHHINEFIKRLVDVKTPIIINDLNEDKIIFKGEGYRLGGEGTISKLVITNKNEQ